MDRRLFLQQLAGGMLLLAGCSQSAPTQPAPQRKRLLVLTETTGYRHDTVPTAVETIRLLGEEKGEWEITARADTADQVRNAITAEGLREIDAVVFANTTGVLSFTPDGRTAFYEWIRNGGAYIGIHSASDTFREDPEYVALLGGKFIGHGPQKEVDIFVQDPEHPACRDLPASFPFYDEIYEFEEWDRSKVHVLLSMHTHPQTGAPGDFPIAWTRRHAKGRMFYSSLGHREDVYTNPRFRNHLAGGILWALGLQAGSETPGNPVR
jgi:type 1 glutamine amidotransferase